MIVMKFGGTSVADAQRIAAVAEIVRARTARGPLVVVSALAGVTDLLERALEAARADDLEALDAIVADLERRHRWAVAGAVPVPSRHQLDLELDGQFEWLRRGLRSIRVLQERTPRAADAILAWGDSLSARIVAVAFAEAALAAEHVDARELLVTDGRFGTARPDLGATRVKSAARVGPLLAMGRVPVTAGFVGATAEGETTTLGRGGSDTTAAILGMALEAEEIQIWTDVDGVMTADPRIVPEARTLARVSFADAAALALAGAKVLHPASIAPAVRCRIPVRVLNTLRPDGPGTWVEADERPGTAGLSGLTSRSPVWVARLASRSLRADGEFRERCAAALARLGRPTELILATDVAMTAVFAGVPRAEELRHEIDDVATLDVLDDRALITAVGTGLRQGALRAAVLAGLAEWEPDLVVLGASERTLAAMLGANRLREAVGALHRRFFVGERVA